jgi:hypothetical protein
MIPVLLFHNAILFAPSLNLNFTFAGQNKPRNRDQTLGRKKQSRTARNVQKTIGRPVTRVVPTTRECSIVQKANEVLMFTNGNQELTVDQVKALLGPPPIMPGESEEEYWKWWTVFVEPDKPKKFLAWLEVNELAHKEWEQKRLRRYRPTLVRRGRIAALTSILQSGFHDGIPLKVAQDYFGNDATEQRKAREIVASYRHHGGANCGRGHGKARRRDADSRPNGQ